MGVQPEIMRDIRTERSLLPGLCLGLFVWIAATPLAPAVAPATSGQSTTQIEAVAEPSHSLVWENKYVRTLKVEVLPGAATLKHRHGHDFFTVTLGAAEISNEVDGKSAATVKLEDGQVRFAEGRGPAHLVKNLASTPFRNVTIELLGDEAGKTAAPPKWDPESGTVTSPDGGSQEFLLIKDGVRASKMILQPGATQPKRQHIGPEMIVAVTDLDLGLAGKAKRATPLRLKARDVKWIEGGLDQTLINRGKKEAKIVLMQFP
jgi:quercetin dioxygenase-like cupin family protein